MHLRTSLTTMLPQLEKAHWTQAAAQFEDDVLEKTSREITTRLLDSPATD